jgi:misacylated tRNA(Ala) deacylase
MTTTLFSEDAYLRQCQATVVAASEAGIELDQTVFYPLGGGQPGDTGEISGAGGTVKIIDTRKSDDSIIHLTEGEHGLKAGDQVTATLDWDRRYIHMRMHTCLHLLGVALPYGVTGGNISAHKSRLDFDMEDLVDKPAVQARLD